jgi:DNA polymerase V
MHGSKFKPNTPSATRVARLSPATNDPRVIAQLAGRMTEVMFEAGRVYTKCGVMLEGLEPEGAAQQDLFARPDPRSPELLAAMDAINGRFGRQTMRLASEGSGPKAYDTKRAFKSPSWTTRIDQVPVAR